MLNFRIHFFKIETILRRLVSDNKLLSVYAYYYQKILHSQRTVIYASPNLLLSMKCALARTTKTIVRKPHSSKAV